MPSTAVGRRAYLAWAVVCIVWGTTYLFIRIALETVPPFLMAAFRWLSAGTLLSLALRLRGERLPGARSYGALALIGVLMIGIGNGGVVWAQQVVPSGLAAVIVGALPFWMVGIERLLPGGEPLSTTRLLGLAIGFAGLVLLVWPEVRVSSGRAFLAGIASLQLASIGWAIGSAYARRRSGAENVLSSSALQMIFAGLALAVVATMRGEWRSLGFSARTGGALAYLIVMGSLVGYTAYAFALKHLPMATVSLYAYINPVIAVALGSLVLNEPFNVRILAAGAVVFTGVALVRR